MEYKLLVIKGLPNKEEIQLKFPMVIGRSPQAGLTINHPSVSRIHCELSEMQGSIIVRDNESANGCFINGERVTSGVLKMGDTLQIGPLTFAAIYKHAGPYPDLNNLSSSNV